MGLTKYITLISLILLTSAINLEALKHKQFIPSLLAQAGIFLEISEEQVDDDVDQVTEADQDADDTLEYIEDLDADADGEEEDDVDSDADSDGTADASDEDLDTESEVDSDFDQNISDAAEFDGEHVKAFAIPTNQAKPNRSLTLDNDSNDMENFGRQTDSRNMENFDKTGELSYKGHLNFAIVTSYQDDEAHSGAVWVLTDNPDEAKAIISGLEKPVNSCFDKENELLYVVDAAAENRGFIYQYDIDYSKGEEVEKYKTYGGNGYYYDELIGDKFKLKDKSYTLVYEGPAATDCAVDSTGNLYFPTVDDHIYGISYTDLYERNKNAHQELLDETAVSGCTGIDVRFDGELWWSNSDTVDTLGTLASMKWLGYEDVLADEKTVEVQHSALAANGLALKKNYAYYITNGQIFAYNIKSQKVTELSNQGIYFKSIAYGGGQIWVADKGRGTISRMYDDIDKYNELDIEVNLVGATGIHLVNANVQRHGTSWQFGAHIAVALALLFL